MTGVAFVGGFACCVVVGGNEKCQYMSASNNGEISY